MGRRTARSRRAGVRVAGTRTLHGGAAAARQHAHPVRARRCRPSTASPVRRTAARTRSSRVRARALAGGLRLVQLRDKEWPRERRLAFARRLVPLAHRHGARVLWNGTADDARTAGCDGVHWTAEALRAARARPEAALAAASCHTRDEIARAGGSRSTSPCLDRWRRRRHIRTRRRSVGTASARASPKRGCPCTRWAALPLPISTARSRMARRVSRCAAAPGPGLATSVVARRRRVVIRRGVVVGRVDHRHPILLARPCAEVDQLAALRAERPPVRRGRPGLWRRTAGRRRTSGRPSAFRVGSGLHGARGTVAAATQPRPGARDCRTSVRTRHRRRTPRRGPCPTRR